MDKINVELIFPEIIVHSLNSDDLNEEKIKQIRLMKNVFSEINLDTVTFLIDWSDYITKAEINYNMKPIRYKEFLILKNEIGFDAAIDVLDSIPNYEENAKVSCEIIFNSNRIDAGFDYFEMIFNHIFLAMNISCPGSFNLFNTHYMGSENKLCKFKLASFTADEVFNKSVENGWPLIERIDLKKTWSWLINEVGVAFHQLAKSPIERSLYGFLHSCASFNDNPSSIIWLSHCIEGIYASPKDSILKTLKRRILLVLGEPPTHKKIFIKSFNEFYDFRSKFVHGTLDVPHPLNNVPDDYYEDFLATMEFGTLIYLSSLQILVKNNITSLCFQENLVM